MKAHLWTRTQHVIVRDFTELPISEFLTVSLFQFRKKTNFNKAKDNIFRLMLTNWLGQVIKRYGKRATTKAMGY